ncbi:hypothetical protein RHSIM_Rhsim06G0014300 [Rhododendron simsii]|uniref:Uncharacterized protein n=1 Tax=Rhododendron simsii TaxID=118357 RepID=A0A834GSE4_RHOSS|nr:hypothetical protein RHSIM_Rhsim06G0014300 [Rhododendron simsii]
MRKIINDDDDDIIATKDINDLTINEKEVEATQEKSSQAKAEEVINQPQDVNGDNQNLPKEWRYVQNHPKELILDDPSKGILVNQAKYAKELIKKFGMEGSKPMSTPMSTSTKLDKDENGKPVNEKMYRGLFYPRGVAFDLVGYSDADFGGPPRGPRTALEYHGGLVADAGTRAVATHAIVMTNGLAIGGNQRKKYSSALLLRRLLSDRNLNGITHVFVDEIHEHGLMNEGEDLASALHAMGDDENAIQDFQKAIDLKPGHVDALYNLGGLYMDMAKALKEVLKMMNRVELCDAISHLKQLQKKRFKGNGGANGEEVFIIIEPSKFKTVTERTTWRQELAIALDVRAFQRITWLSRCDVELLKEMTENNAPVSYSGMGVPEKSICKASLEVILHRLLNFLKPETFVETVKTINQKILSVLDESELGRVDLGMFFAVLAPICGGTAERRKRVAFDALLWRPVKENSTQIQKVNAQQYIKLLRAIYFPSHEFLAMFDDPDWGFGVVSGLVKLESVDRNRHGNHVCSVCRYPFIGSRLKEMKSHFSLSSQCYSEGKVPPTFKLEEYKFKKYARAYVHIVKLETSVVLLVEAQKSIGFLGDLIGEEYVWNP